MEGSAGGAVGLTVGLHGRPWHRFPLSRRLKENLGKTGLQRTTILQDLALTEVLKGRDLILKARRGSGKGLFVVVAALNRLSGGNGDREFFPRALILAPEAARVVFLREWARRLSEGLEIEITALSSEDRLTDEDLRALENIGDLLIITPDGLNRALKWHLLKLHGLKLLIVDELEKMVARSLTFTRQLLQKLPPPERRQTLVLMEDLTYPALEVAAEITREPEEIYVEEGRLDFSSVDLSVIHISKEEKFSLLLGLLRRRGWPRALIFVNEKSEAQKLTDDLKALGLKAVFLKPELPLPLRLNFLKLFARGEARIMVATDAGCRFIQDPELDLVINYDLPEIPSDFLQRAARVRKAPGEIVSLCDETGAFFLEGIEELIGKRMRVIFPEPEEEWLISPAEVREELGGSGRPPARAPRVRRGKFRPRSRR
ncbi:DEAD/DEAH box helicase [Thermosulfurimonas sp. F29]|uniref:DEAD/DEAH box helicase n=1 Tax=Thermosulfurimonas sp. F29 TaxID=2867247 RepID=UPI001C8354EA|nr:DEAD/DEAH box helicase [Thermosulfurimonas sp. F29]MBX6422252.1 DEAD/DEAH box helicase [Thermosulfurimonas sp. F29]